MYSSTFSKLQMVVHHVKAARTDCGRKTVLCAALHSLCGSTDIAVVSNIVHVIVCFRDFFSGTTLIWASMMLGDLFWLFESPLEALSSPVIWMFIVMVITGILYLVGPCRAVKRRLCSDRQN